MYDKTNQQFSFVVVLPGRRKTLSFDLSRTLVATILIAVVLGVCALVGGSYMMYNTSIRHSQLTALKVENTSNQSELRQLNQQLDSLKKDMVGLLEREEELRLLLGESQVRKRYKKRKKKRLTTAKSVNAVYKSIKPTSKDEDSADHLVEKVAFLETVFSDAKTAFSSMLDRAHRYKARFANTPSIRPLYGRILSRYGMRRHPILRKRRFHKGIDIAAWWGAPIQATASGIVEYSGWSGSFGYVIVLDHNYGYRTVYAHCSQLLVKTGELVRKGQVVAQVGSTGVSTGPHLHYEVRKWRKSINPYTFLDLDMFTASTKIW